jgi:hypothetical protein
LKNAVSDVIQYQCEYDWSLKNYKGFGRRYYDNICLKGLRIPSRVQKQPQKLNPRYCCALFSKYNLFLDRQDYRILTISTDVQNLPYSKIFKLNLS